MRYGTEMLPFFTGVVEKHGVSKASEILSEQGFPISRATLYKYLRNFDCIERYPDEMVQQFKHIVRQHGITHGCDYINKHGVTIRGENMPYKISVPTLRKLVKSDQAGEPVKIAIGRRAR